MISKFYNKNYSYLFFIVVLGISIFCIYSQSFHFDYALDDHLILENLPSSESRFEGFKIIFTSRYNISDYRPITIASFHLEQLLFGSFTPNSAHAINVFIYFLLICSTLHLTSQIITTKTTGRNFLIFSVVALFCFHPIHANVVSNIKSRDNLLSALFLMMSLIFLFNLIKNKIKISSIVLSILFFILAFYSKKDAISYLLIAPLSIILFKGPDIAFNKRYIKNAIGIFIIAFLVLRITTIYIDNQVPVVESNGISKSIVRFTENPLVETNSLPPRVNAYFNTQFLYLKMFIYPKDYYFYFGYNVFKFPFKGGLAWLSFFTIAGVISLGIYNLNKNKLLSFGIFFMGINLIYCSNLFVSVAGIIADRYAFIASFGFCIILAILINLIKTNALKYVSILIIISIYGYFSYDRVKNWESLETLIEADIDHLEQSHEAQRIAANFYWNKADSLKNNNERQLYYNKALKHIIKANEIYPKNYITQIHEGTIRFKLNDLDNSILSFQKSIDLDTSHYKLGIELLADTYYLKRNYKEAISYYSILYKENPDKQYLLNNISTILYESGDKTASLRFNDSLIVASPQLYAPYENLAYYYLFENDTSVAVSYFNKALEVSDHPQQIKEIIDAFKAICSSCPIKSDDH
ncbi:MAG: hypothetical protein R2730_05400 [Chitinophagales bacterium]